MAKIESSFRNMVLSLTFISLGASVALGFVHEFTKEPIEVSKLKKKIEAVKMVVPEYNNDPVVEMFKLPSEWGDSLDVYPAKKDNEIVGYGVKTYSKKGYSGKITLAVGFKPDGTIINITVLEQKETPGLGTKMALPAFVNQFIDKDPSSFQLKVKKDGGQVDAITAATISSRAFCDAVQNAYSTLKKGDLK
jgi:Na+-translocating ferredoxin:NAD+ oxidoreductase subunit G